MSALTSQSSAIQQNFTNPPGFSTAVHLKPKITYIDLIREAILSFPGNPSLQEIYNYIQKTYPFYHPKDDGWKNSVRHTLSLSPLFKNIPRVYPQPGKGGLWRINPDAPVPTSKRKDKSSKGPALSGKSSRSPYSPGGKKRSSGMNPTSHSTTTHPLNPTPITDTATDTATDSDRSDGRLFATPSSGTRGGSTFTSSSSSSTTMTEGYTPLSNNLYGPGPQLSPVSPHDHRFRPLHQHPQQQQQQQQQQPPLLQRNPSSWNIPPYSAPLSTYTEPSCVTARPGLNLRQTYPAPNQFPTFNTPTAQFGSHASLSGSSSLATPVSLLDVSSSSSTSTLSTSRSPNLSDHSESHPYPTPGYDTRSFDQNSPQYESARHPNTAPAAAAVYRPQLSYAFPTPQHSHGTNHPGGGPSLSDHHHQQQQQGYYQSSVASQQHQSARYTYSEPVHQSTSSSTDPRSASSITTDTWKPSQRLSQNAHQGLPSFSTLLPIPGSSLSSSSSSTAQVVPPVPPTSTMIPSESAQSSAYNHYQYQRPIGNDIHSTDARGRPFASHAAQNQQRQSPTQLSQQQQQQQYQQHQHLTDSYFPPQPPNQPFQSFQSYPIQDSLVNQSSN